MMMEKMTRRKFHCLWKNCWKRRKQM